MERTNRSGNTKTRPVKNEDEASSSSKTPQNKNPVEEMINLNLASEDSSVLFSHLPEKIWRLITDKYLDSESLTNLSQASLGFRNLLLPRRVEFLFPQVWKVLGVKFEKRESEVYSYNFDELYPGRDLSRFRLKETPWYSRILTLRLVCKTWCEGVDKFYEDLTSEEENKIEEERINSYSKGKRMGNWTHHTATFFDFDATLKKFSNHFGPTHVEGGKWRNPIIGRHISMDVEDGHEIGTFDLLSKYGHHFWFCDLSLTWDDNWFQCYTVLKEILQLLPNLKTLNLSFPYDLEDDELEQEIASNPLPKLHQLQVLSVLDLPKCVFNALVSVNNHISMLEVAKSSIPTSYNIYSFPMPNLKKLSMPYPLETDFENLSSTEVNWALEKIYLRFDCNPLVSKLQIFSLLENKWATTLTNVALSFAGTNIGRTLDTDAINDDLSLRLNLPKVQRFKIISEDVFCLDFILPMQSLEFLEIGVDKIKRNETIQKRLHLLEKKQIVEFVGFFGRFHESNIWNLIPNLKGIQFCDADSLYCGMDAYKREGFESIGRTGATGGPTTCNEKGNLWLYRST